MTKGLYDAVSSMAAAERRLDVVAQNIANASAIGFKRQVGAVHSFEQMINGELVTGQGLSTMVDFQQGELIETGNTLDLGLMGDGFFTFELEGGDVAYTRDGSLRLTAEGDLVSRGGRPVVWEQRLNQVEPTGIELTIDGAGHVFQGNLEIGQLKLVDFEDRSKLSQDDKGYFHAPKGVTPDPATGVVYQGTYETSNVQAVSEMVEMILAQRAYQSASNTVSQIAESYSKLTNLN